ncbi:MAG: hypothetical protein FWG54_01710 [Bacteroidetes bacterium]|nr:hypothetical protein [Bacteroidota bacterium]
MINYLIRFVKYFVYLCILIAIMLALVFYLSDHRGEYRHFWELIPTYNFWQMGLFLFVFAAIYPIISYVDRKVYLNRSFDLDKDLLINVLLNANYQIESDNDYRLVFRHKNAFTRFMRLYEDKITLDYSDNPIVLNGLRRDVYRFARTMEYVVRQHAREQE